MPGSPIIRPMSQVSLHRYGLSPDDSYLEEWVEERNAMSAWEWEAQLFPFPVLDYLIKWPCSDFMDGQFIVLASDWLSKIQELCDEELRSRSHQIHHQGPYAFAGLFNLLYKVHELVFRYYWRDVDTRETFEQHRTIWRGIPRSGLTQARFTIATLAKMGFGAWLEDLPTYTSYPPMSAMTFDFHFDRHTRVLGWANVNEHPGVLPRHTLHLVFPAERNEPADRERDTEFNRTILSWLMNVDDETLVPDTDSWDTTTYVGDSSDDDEYTLVNSSDQGSFIDFQPGNDDDGDDDGDDDDDNDDAPSPHGKGGSRHKIDNDNNEDNNDDGNDDNIETSDEDEDNDNDGQRPYYGPWHDDLEDYYHLWDDDDDNYDDDGDSGYEGSLLFSLEPSDNGYDDGVWIDNSSDSGYDGSMSGDSETDTDSSLDSDDKLKKEKETAVAVHRPADHPETATTTEDTESTATTTSNNDNDNDLAHVVYPDALGQPIRGTTALLLAYIQFIARPQQQPPAYSERGHQGESDAPPAYEEDDSPPEYTFDSD
ncbi:hypothetical protein F5Y05DRAFT_419011 [Hypoxylon sp. FL0543]|nr:hypothetical protein F5Y05DRAFT_419011 [Hypoxylon sp. FL0543]